MIRLLSKSDVQIHKARERQQSVDEGLKIAHRVDSLRKVAANEEASLEKFRSMTLQNIQTETATKISERDALLVEVHNLEAQKQEALKPLTDELNRITEGKRELENRSDYLSKWEDDVVAKRKMLDKKQKDLDVLEKRVDGTRITANQELAEANEKNVGAEKALRDATKIFDTTSRQCFEREQAVSKRESEVGAREFTLLNQHKALEAKEKELSDRERAIDDKYKTLIRSQARLKI